MALTTDPRTDEMTRDMAEFFAEFEQDYREAEWCSIVHEDDDRILIADSKGVEFSEWREEFGDGFSEAMHELAEQLTDRRWAADYPVVFDKLD